MNSETSINIFMLFEVFSTYPDYYNGFGTVISHREHGQLFHCSGNKSNNYTNTHLKMFPFLLEPIT